MICLKVVQERRAELWPSPTIRQTHVALPDSHRGVRWRRSCYPAVTPALELVSFELREPGERAVSVGRRGDLQAALGTGDWPVTYM
jgi:hypothetical protein